MTATESPATSLAAALARVQAGLPVVAKDNVGTVRSEKANYTFAYADLSDISAVVLPALGRAGLAWTTLPTLVDGGRFVLAYRLLHGPSGQALEGAYPLPDPSRTTPQQLGSAISYARRHALCSVTGVAPGGDDTAPPPTTPAARSSAAGRPGQRAADPSAAAVRDASRPPRGDGTPGGGAPPAPAADVDDDDPAGADPDDRMTGPQQRRLFALLRESDIADRDTRMAWASQVLDREISSYGQLSVADAARLIDDLAGAGR